MTYRSAMARLPAAQKSRKGAPAYSVYVNRPLGRRAAAAAYVVGLTPNQVTGLSALCTSAGIGLLAVGDASWPIGIAVALLLVVGYALDAADGQLARLRGGGSVAGEWLDHVVDAAKTAAIHGAVLLHLHRESDWSERWLLLPLGYTVVSVVLFFAQLLNEQLRRGRTDPGAPTGGDRRDSAVLAVMKLPVDYGFFCLLFVLLGSTPAFLVVYAGFFLGASGYLALAAPKWFREMGALDREPAA